MRNSKRNRRSAPMWALILSIFIALLPSPFVRPQPAEAAAFDLKLEVKAAILIEAETGQVLYEYNADEPLPPASMSKMMTEYLVLEQIQQNKLKWDDIVTASRYAATVGGSGGMIGIGEKLTVKDVFYEMSIYSGNDGSVALAEHIAGSEENFARMMNAKARELGLSDQAHFINATGLPRADLGANAPAGIPGETLMSARDAAKLARRLILDHPEILEFTRIPSKKLRERDKDPMINYNWMLEGNINTNYLSKYAYPGLDGLKTGSTDEAGYCFTGTAQRDGMRLISVVMGTSSEPKRFDETRKLLDYGFNQFEKRTVVSAKSEVAAMKAIPIKKGTKTEAPVVAENALALVVPKGTKDDEFVFQAEAADENSRIAPIKQGDVLGKLTVSFTLPGDIVVSQETNLVAAEDVGKGSWFKLLFRAIRGYFADLFTSIKNQF